MRRTVGVIITAAGWIAGMGASSVWGQTAAKAKPAAIAIPAAPASGINTRLTNLLNQGSGDLPPGGLSGAPSKPMTAKALTSPNFGAEPDPPPSNSPFALEKQIAFDSLRYWIDSRWYIIGRWEEDGTIRWLGGRQTKYSFPNANCSSGEGTPILLRAEGSESKTAAGGKKAINREILRRNRWFMIEVSPDVASESFEIRSPMFKEFPECRTTVSFNYGWKKERTEVRPILFLKPHDTFFNHEVIIYAPDKPERANIQLDLMLGFWKGSFPSAAVNAVAAQKKTYDTPSKSVTFLPAAISRGEWLLPFNKDIGLSLALEQTLHSSSSIATQKVLLSDWFVGAFYQKIFPIVDGLQARAFVRYGEHTADQSSEYDTVAEPNRQLKSFIVGGTANMYFAVRWLLGADFEYGAPNTMAGRGVKQSYMAYYGRLGYRLTSFMQIIGEGGIRTYKSEGYASEKLLQTQLGIRLEL